MQLSKLVLSLTLILSLSVPVLADEGKNKSVFKKETCEYYGRDGKCIDRENENGMAKAVVPGIAGLYAGPAALALGLTAIAYKTGFGADSVVFPKAVNAKKYKGFKVKYKVPTAVKVGLAATLIISANAITVAVLEIDRVKHGYFPLAKVVENSTKKVLGLESDPWYNDDAIDPKDVDSANYENVVNGVK